MSNGKSSDQRLSRRKALKKIAGTASGAVTFPILGAASRMRRVPGEISGVATAAQATYGPRFFNADQMETLAVLAEHIIPADEHSAGARAARVHEYIDVIIAESSQSRKEIWTAGLGAIDKMAARDYGAEFKKCSAGQQIDLLQKISANEPHPSTLEEKFFIAIKSATIEGYYTSEIGIHQELEYQGNTALVEFPGCAHIQHKKPVQ
jgi:hypothetical protein